MNSKPYKNKQRNGFFKGLVLFDIDGTLSDGTYEDNFQTVNYCLRSGYAVGICTAGSVYTPENLPQFSWMPENLVQFMIQTRNKTFNNVARGYICNTDSRDRLRDMQSILRKCGIYVAPPEMIGYVKGYAAAVTGGIFKIPTERIYLLDNDIDVLKGFKNFDKRMTGVPAGLPAGNQFTIETVKNVLLP